MKFWRIFPGMSCLPCLSSHVTKIKRERTSPPKDHVPAHAHDTKKKKKSGGEANKKFTNVNQDGIDAWHFTFRELATATRNFKQDCLLGEGAFSKVFKGTLKGTGKVVAVKQLDRSGLQENGEFLVEVKALSLLKHENLVDLIGYCAEGDQRLLVYEYLPGGTVEHRLLDSGGNKEELDWLMRMKIAYGAAKGLEYLHGSFDPPIIHGYLKSSNIMLDECLQPKLTDFGLAKLGSAESNMHVSSRAMRTYGYCAPEYTSTGELTTKSDVYSFGVVLLELICGRRAIDPTKPPGEQNLVTWASPKFRDPKLFPDLAEPLLEGKFPEKHLNQAVAIAAMCLQEEASVRPLMCDLVTALSFLSADPDEHVPDSIAVVDQLIESLHKRDNETGNGKDNDSETDD